jgi:hypothetical protein
MTRTRFLAPSSGSSFHSAIGLKISGGVADQIGTDIRHFGRIEIGDIGVEIGLAIAISQAEIVRHHHRCVCRECEHAS